MSYHTTDPRITPATYDDGQANPKVENPGLITSDSLAAESVRANASFGGDDPSSRAPMQQPSSSSTANTTDTSGATVLEAAPDAPSRYVPGLDDGRIGSAGERGQGRQTQGERGYGQGQGQGQGSYGSRGVDDDDADFAEGRPNASFTTDIGGKNDPGRAALGQFEARNAEVPGSSVAGGNGLDDGQSRFDALRRNESA